jgi:rhomboid protease GluP
MNITLDKNDEIVMKLLHYFITEKGYNPIILHGAKDEIWLENSEGEYSIVRIVTNYIHNDEQFDYDIFKTKQIMRSIKRKTFSFSMNALSIFVNLGENVHLEENNEKLKNIDCIELKDINDINNYKFVIEAYPDILEIEDVKEEGLELFMKLTEEINKKNVDDASKADEIFSKKRPVVTYALIISNIIMFIMCILAGGNPLNMDPNLLYNFGGMVNYSTMSGPAELYRLVTSMFLHGEILHIGFNMYALYVLGPQLESFFGKTKYIIIYFVSGIIGNLVSMVLQQNNIVSVGASGAIFGLIGAFLYFGYHYRVYLGTVIKSQIIPLLVLNLGIGFFAQSVNMAAHIGGLVGGILGAKAVGVKYKTTLSDQINGIIMILLLAGAILYIGGVF